MNLRYSPLHVSALCLAAVLAGSPAHAQTRVGEAAVIQNEVVRVAGSATSQINVGDGVLRDEIVRTGLDSAARLVMADSTNLSLGPSASIKLDRTVFNDEHTYRDIAVRLTTGGVSLRHRTFRKDRLQDHHAARDDRRARHRARYPVAAGQDHRGAAGRRLARLHPDVPVPRADASPAIPRSSPRRGGKATIHKTNHPSWNFAANCAAAAGLCTVTQYADATPAVTPPVDDGSDPTGMLCGR